ncbi:DUF6090 family protein [Croceivirga thetidis]|uniref:CBM11 domain-containing protein n=1 Tax=Croceivirga thetidis TaxID=2721623 RepID=A0ABX1GKI4_9FLAO|nr:DUF6090 family protein [Croceivirga thetidis]NKI30425.1 hypothetical protein [Croceivirga thetidis]
MIKFFRRIRQKLLSENRFSKYLIYALGEIVLVVIGILIALQINNWNENRIQTKELDGLLKSISRAIQTDVKNLHLIKRGRENIGQNVDSIFNGYIDNRPTALNFNDYAFIGNTFGDLNTTIYYQPNTSSFEALKNSIYLSKLQGTDIEILLHTFYATANRIQKHEEEYNQMLRSDNQAWTNKFRNNGSDLLTGAWNYKESQEKFNRFLEILKDEYTTKLLANGFEEEGMTNMYNELIVLGEKFIEMVNNQQMNFDEQTKIDFSSILNSYEGIDQLNLLVNGKVPSNFGFLYAQSSNEYYPGIEFKDDHVVLIYPEKKFAWGAPFFTIEALNGRVTEMDFSKYKNVILEMKGAKGGEELEITMKDKYDPPDGSEARASLTLTNDWKTYQVPIAEFKTADMSIIQTPLAFVFVGEKGKTIHVKSIRFK